MSEKMRIYVGGLGSNVQEEDLKKTFGSPHLGIVESVEINRNKGRGFGYMDFVPASEKGLAKLFSAYNGCMWKGGRLKLEKAKEHFLSRLRREWTEDAELVVKPANQCVDPDESMHSTSVLQKFKEDQDIETHLRIFFPKLRKVKPLPLKGSGKHKYSFQRVEIPPLPVHFCDCEEHSGPSDLAKKHCNNDHEKESFGVNEEELNIMKSVLNKILEKENCSSTVSNETEFTKEIKCSLTSVNNSQVNDNDDYVSDDDDDDDDNLVINVAPSSKRAAVFEDWGQKVSNETEFTEEMQLADNEDLVSDDDNLVINVAQSSNRAALLEDWGLKKHVANQVQSEVEYFRGSQKRRILPDKKRKSALVEQDTVNNVASKRKVVKRSSHDFMDDAIPLNSQPIEAKSVSTQLKSDAAFSKKSAWKTLGKEMGSTSFHISDILTNSISELKASFNGKDSQDCELNKNKELEKQSDAKLNKLSAFEDKLAGGDTEDDQSNKKDEMEKQSDVQMNKSSAFEGKLAEGDSEDDQSNKKEELEKQYDVQMNKSSAFKDKLAGGDSEDEQSNKINEFEKVSDVQSNKNDRGASWLQKSSWLQLVGDTTSSSFNLGQILPPDVTFEKQELQQIDFSGSRNGNQHGFTHKGKNSNKLQGKESKDIYDGVKTPNVDALVKEQNHDNSVGKQKVEDKEDMTATMAGSNIVSNRSASSAGRIVISETCPFMRSAASMKEWAKTKSALSASLQKKEKKKEPGMD